MLDPRSGRQCHDQLIELLASALREVAGDGLADLPINEQTLIAGVVGVVRMMVMADRVSQLPAAAPDAIYFLLSPYLGTERAIAVAARDIDHT
jgi:hypothetical protein